MSVLLEIDCIRAAHELGVLTAPYAFDIEQARGLTEAGTGIDLAAYLESGGAPSTRTTGARANLLNRMILSGTRSNCIAFLPNGFSY